MANAVTAKLTKLSNQYNENVKERRRLEAQLRGRGGAGVSDAEAKRLNGLIDALKAEFETINEERNRLAKLQKTAKDYTNLQSDIKEIQAQINRAEARGESTTSLQAKKDTLTQKFDSIAPTIEEAFPDIKAKPVKETTPVPSGPTGTAITPTTAAAPATPAVKKPAVKKPASKEPTAKPFTEPMTIAGQVTIPTATGTKTATGTEDINAIYSLARSKYGNVDSIFLYDPELKQLLIDAVGDPATAKDDMDASEFARRLGASDWSIRNASTYAKRDAERRQYTETLDKYNQQLELADTQEKKDAILSKIGQLKTTSSYARGLESAKAYIEATASGLTGTMSPERLDAFVKRMYDSGNDKDPNIINRELAALVSYKPGMQLGGSVGGDLTTLRATARANGFNLDTSFGSSINDWLQRLAKGESIETFKNTIRGAAKLGLPDKVANLLDQGLDLKDIYDPYKKVMASVLEVAPNSISLDDKTLRMAIGPEKEMSIYDFQRTLRKDPRWQYTNNAREEASDAVLGVLRNFGLQG
jgi:hypothetical protein